MTCTRRDREGFSGPTSDGSLPDHFAPRLKGIADFAKYPELRFLDRFDILVPTIAGFGMFGFGKLWNLCPASRNEWTANAHLGILYFDRCVDSRHLHD